MMKFRPIFREFLQCLVARRVRFIVVGAHALGALARPRYTGDLDVLVEPTAANARRVIAALRDFGFEPPASYLKELTRPDRMTHYGVAPQRIDVMTSITGVTFREAWRGRTERTVAGLPLAFLGEAEFVKNKRASGRPKDLVDLALLDERPKKR